MRLCAAAASRSLSVDADNGRAISLRASSGVSACRCAVSHVLRGTTQRQRPVTAERHCGGEPVHGVAVCSEDKPAARSRWPLLHERHRLADEVGAAPADGHQPRVAAPHQHSEPATAEFLQVADFRGGDFRGRSSRPRTLRPATQRHASGFLKPGKAAASMKPASW